MSLELEIPIQPKTKVVARDLLESEQNTNEVSKVKKAQLKSQTFINCDLRFFNLNFLVD